MRRALRFLLWGLIVVALGGALLGFFVYSPVPEVPRLTGKLIKGTIEVGERERTYLTYMPQGLTQGAPLVVVMHGSGQNGAQMRETLQVLASSEIRKAVGASDPAGLGSCQSMCPTVCRACPETEGTCVATVAATV